MRSCQRVGSCHVSIMAERDHLVGSVCVRHAGPDLKVVRSFILSYFGLRSTHIKTIFKKTSLKAQNLSNLLVAP